MRDTHYKTVLLVFWALLVDILSFSILLPLLPRLLTYYKESEYQIGTSPKSLFALSLDALRQWKSFLGVTGSDLDIIMYGGWISSMYSLLQSIVSPLIGRLSDTHGRKRVLLWCMIGNCLSCLLWVFAGNFYVFVLSRVIAGVSEANVQITVSIITDLTSTEERSRYLALVGVAFALGFILGPPTGAFLASYKLDIRSEWAHPYIMPAAISLLLVLLETFALCLALPETLNLKLKEDQATKEAEKDIKKEKNTENQATALEKAKNEKEKEIEKTKAYYKNNIRKLSYAHFYYVFLLSGVEFTVPFLCHEKFAFTHGRQGALFAIVGVVAALVQGGYTRRFAKTLGERRIACQGIASCAIAYAILAVRPELMYLAMVFLGVASGTVITSLTSLSSICSMSDKKKTETPGKSESGNSSGRTMGEFRSWGQFGRGIGPIVFSLMYWLQGPTLTYSVGFTLMMGLSYWLMKTVPEIRKEMQAKIKTT